MPKIDKNMARINNSQDLADLYENIHHLLWTREGFSPEKAMDHLNVFLYLMCIEPQIEAGNIDLPEYCKFSHLAQIENADELLLTIKGNIKHPNCVQAAINKNPMTKDYFTRIEIQYPDTVFNLIKHLNRIDLTIDDKDFLGGIYEYIIGRGMTTMSDDGQYFTERAICRHAMELAGINTGIAETMIDPFCGTGGFITEYVKTVQRDVADKASFWKQNMDKIYGNDIKVSSVMSTLLNLIFVTGVSFNKENVIHKNSLYESLFNGKKFKYIFTNPPFGGDKSKGDDFKFKYGEFVKGKPKKPENYVFKVSEDIKSIGIQIDDKVAAAVQLCMALLDDNGTCGIVLPEGFFFQSGKQLIELRKKLIEDFNVKYVVDIPQGVFENTSTKTCLMIFSKSGKTSEVEFIDFMKRDSAERTLVKATLDELKSKDYSLNYKRYVKHEWNNLGESKIYKIGDVCILNPDSILKSDQYDMIRYLDLSSVSCGTISNINEIRFEEAPSRAKRKVNIDDVLIGTVRPNLQNHCYITKDIFSTKLIVSTGFCVLRVKDATILHPRYLFHLIMTDHMKSIFTDKATGSSYPSLNTTVISNIEIALPTIERQKEIVEEIDNYAVRASKMKDLVKDMEKGLMFAVRRMYKELECNITTIKDVIEKVNGKKRNTTEACQNGMYPLYSSSLELSNWINEYDYDKECLIINSINADGNSNVHIANRFCVTSNTFVFKSKNEVVSNVYMYFYLKNNIQALKQCYTGTTKKKFTTSYFMDMTIPFPSRELQNELIEDYTLMVSMLNKIKRLEAQTLNLISKL